MKNNNQIEILGYAGHSYICIEIAQSLNFKVLGYYDPEKNNINPYSLTYLGTDKSITGKNLLFVSIGDNSIRRRLFNFLLKILIKIWSNSFCDNFTPSSFKDVAE